MRRRLGESSVRVVCGLLVRQLPGPFAGWALGHVFQHACPLSASVCCEARTALSAPVLGCDKLRILLLSLKPCRPRLLQLRLHTLLQLGPRLLQLDLQMLGATRLFQLNLNIFGTSGGFELRCRPRLLQLSPSFLQLGVCRNSAIVGFELLHRPCLLQLNPRPLQLGLRTFEVRFVIGHLLAATRSGGCPFSRQALPFWAAESRGGQRTAHHTEKIESLLENSLVCAGSCWLGVRREPWGSMAA